jgi:RNase adapter protein RapZ
MQLVLITGYSGAGKSIALKACEDLGFACMDNIPMSVIASVIGAVEDRIERLAICSDIRSPDFNAPFFMEEVQQLKARYACHLWFLTCRNDILVARFNGTKHRHPLYQGDSLLESLKREEHLLEPLRMAADGVIDTSDYTPHSLKQHLAYLTQRETDTLSVQLVSFSYQRGLPQNADLVFDVRFLKNPYYDAALRLQTGKDVEVANFINKDSNLDVFLTHITAMLIFLLPLYQLEGKSYLTLAFGCTGGRHRSVYLCEILHKMLKNMLNSPIIITHRELVSI